jgi:hypothetical protein
MNWLWMNLPLVPLWLVRRHPGRRSRVQRPDARRQAHAVGPAGPQAAGVGGREPASRPLTGARN